MSLFQAKEPGNSPFRALCFVGFWGILGFSLARQLTVTLATLVLSSLKEAHLGADREAGGTFAGAGVSALIVGFAFEDLAANFLAKRTHSLTSQLATIAVVCKGWKDVGVEVKSYASGKKTALQTKRSLPRPRLRYNLARKEQGLFFG